MKSLKETMEANAAVIEKGLAGDYPATMKKYILFGYDQYYPFGGLHDIKGSYDTLLEARRAKTKDRSDNHDIVDRDSWKIVE